MLQSILEKLEPANVYAQAYLPRHERSFRMRLSDAFYRIFKRYL